MIQPRRKLRTVTHRAPSPHHRPDDSGLVTLSSTEGRVILFAVSIGAAIALLAVNLPALALPAISDDLGADAAQQKWVINGFLLTLSSLILVSGSLADHFGRVRVYRLGMIGLGLTSLGSALATGTTTLIVSRLLQGVFAALVTPGGLAIIESTYVRRDRARAIGAWVAISAAGYAIGPLVGGLVLELSWRWVFLINVPLGLIVLALTRNVPNTFDPASAAVRVDWTGAALSATALGALSYALIEGPEGLSGPVVGAVILLGLTATILIRQQRRHPYPVIPYDLFSSRDFAATNLLTFFVFGGLGVAFFLLVVQLQVVAGWSPLAAGAGLLPTTVMLMLFSTVGAGLTDRIGVRLPLVAGSVFMAFGVFLLRFADRDATFLWPVLPANIAIGGGLVFVAGMASAVALASAPDSRSGAASGVNNAVARGAQMIVFAAVLAVVGLNGDALSSAAKLSDRYSTAMTISAVFILVGSAIALRVRPDALGAGRS